MMMLFSVPDSRRLLSTLLLMALVNGCWASTEIVTLQAPESGKDPRPSYTTQLVRLALEKTRTESGDYEVRFSTPMNTARALAEARANTAPNLLVLTTFRNEILDMGLDYARFPTDFGVTGYRICFVSPRAQNEASALENIKDLRRLTIAQGIGWADVDILRYNQLQVHEVGGYESMFGMVASSRVDLFCRGINELQPELLRHAGQTKLLVDKSFALVYPLPRFFFSSEHNAPILKRLARGMQIAWQDGSLRNLWLEEFRSALEFAQLQSRRLFYLQNPYIDRIDFDYQQYYFDPQKPF